LPFILQDGAQCGWHAWALSLSLHRV